MTLPNNRDPESLQVELREFLAHDFWRCAIDKVTVTRVHGGITNLLFKAHAEGAAEYPFVLARIFGEGGSLLIDRVRERVITEQLSNMRFGPRIARSFDSGRLEEFFPDKASIESQEMLKLPYRPLVARRLAEMHSLAIEDDYSPGEAGIWRNLEDWLDLAEGTSRTPPIPLNILEGELIWASDYIRSLVESEFQTDSAKKLAEIVFCHNDLLGGNILYSKASGCLVFIDFEYATYNYAAFDIANHFCAVPESALIAHGLYTIDNMPTVAEQSAFLSEYLGSSSEDDFSEALTLVSAFGMLAELRWIVWAVVQAERSSVVFDYDNYARERFTKGYLRMKQAFTPL
jgi:thiamine kinase-like enzyme